jgi:hypothetical protein
LFAYGIFKLIYAPHKAFKEIIQKPRYLGPLIIMVIFVIANSGFYYVWFSKNYNDQTVPDRSEFDKWTENSAFWSSNAPIIKNNTDNYVNGTYCGYQSVEFQANSITHIWMQLNITDSINCSGEQGYKNLTFSVKMVGVEKPSNASLYLFSTNFGNNFYYNLTGQLDVVDDWNIITVAIGPESHEWKSNTVNADWSNIIGLMLDFTWENESDVTLLIDGLFFHGLYKPLIETDSSYLFVLPISTVMQFAFQWVILGFMLYLVPKFFKFKTVFRTWLIVAGFALIAIVIQTIAFTVASFLWPNLYGSLQSLGGIPGEPEEAYMQSLVSLVTVFWCVDKVIWVWIIVLCAIAFKTAFEISWLKSFLIAVPSYLLYVLMLLMLGVGAVIVLYEWELMVILFAVIACIASGYAIRRKTIETTKSN